ncbi:MULTISPECIES: hypothetical protein [unclassified Pseudomonas]|uniref:hypothetical protein n=1 Tax=unclassified Pseudomonas TaxID=196821 RepID=UPI00117AE7E7|nr:MULTISPECIES: hypothetical protein [unclassified Pseudomonas]
MSDWEDFCDGMGWRNDEHATDKLIDYIEGKNPKNYSGRRDREFTPEQKRAYAIKKEEERRIFSTPIGQYIASHWGRGDIFNIKESMWTDNGSNFKSIYFEIGKGFFHVTITKCNETNFTVEFCNITGRSPICTQISGNRLTPSLIEQAVSENDKLVSARNRR